MRALAKSKLLAYRQCHRRFWLEIHRPGQAENSASTEMTFQHGNNVGELARKLYDPGAKGILIDIKVDGLEGAFAKTREALSRPSPVFEAGFTGGGALSFADVMLPIKRAGKLLWRMIEVKSSTAIKDYYRDDVAVQAFAASSAGIKLDSISIAHINREFVYDGNGKYDGILLENDVTADTVARADEVRSWIADGQTIASRPDEPAMQTGRHCGEPFE